MNCAALVEKKKKKKMIELNEQFEYFLLSKPTTPDILEQTGSQKKYIKPVD